MDTRARHTLEDLVRQTVHGGLDDLAREVVAAGFAPKNGWGSGVRSVARSSAARRVQDVRLAVAGCCPTHRPAIEPDRLEVDA
jgi:hypothetical protein